MNLCSVFPLASIRCYLMLQPFFTMKYLGLNLNSHLIPASRLRVHFGKMEIKHTSTSGCGSYWINTLKSLALSLVPRHVPDKQELLL